METKFDIGKMMKQMKDYFILEFVGSQIENEKDRKFICNAMQLFMDYGIPSEKAFEILGKLSKLTEEYNK